MCKNNLAKVDLHLHHLGTKMMSYHCPIREFQRMVKELLLAKACPRVCVHTSCEMAHVFVRGMINNLEMAIKRSEQESTQGDYQNIDGSNGRTQSHSRHYWHCCEITRQDKLAQAARHG